MSQEMILMLLVLLVTTSAFLHEDLIAKFCEAKNVKMGSIISCQSKKENISLLKDLGKKGFRFLVINKLNQHFRMDYVLKRKYYSLAVIVDGDCISSTEIYIKDQKYFYEMYHWLIFSVPETYEENLNFLRKLPLNINSEVNVVVMDNKKNEYEIFDVYNPASNHSGQFTVSKIGYYNKHHGFRARFTENKYWRRKNMTGVQFKTAVVAPNPQISLKEYLASQEDRQINSMHRFQSVTIHYCKDMYNFSLDIQRTNSWGYLTPNGHFDGLVGLLERRLVDFGSSPLIYKLDRMPVIDYSYGNWILKSTFIYKRPKIIEASYKIFMRPLSTTVWLAIASMMVVLMIFLKLIFTRETRILKDSNQVDNSWSFLFLFTLGAFCQQGATCYPQLLSSRTLSVFIFLFCILIYQFYSASIVSYLLMDPARKINNLKDLTDSNLRAGIEEILIDRNYFVQTTDPVAIELFNKKIKGDSEDSGYYEPAEGLSLVRKGDFAYHVETSTAYPIIEATFTNEEICELEEVQMYRTQPMHTNLQKDSPFREMMNYCMLHIVENGLMYRLRKYWDARKPICLESAKKVSIHVGLKEFSSGLIVLTYGVFSSLLILLIEVLIFKKEIIIAYFLKKRTVHPYTE